MIGTGKNRIHIRLAAGLIATTLVSGAGFLPVMGQETLRPARPVGTSKVWTNEVDIPATPPKTSRIRRLPRPERAPLLTLQWRLLKRVDEEPKEVNPMSAFYTGDKLQIEIQANQDGYLYVINQTDGGEATIEFPSSRINYGENYVKKNVPYLVPSVCPEFEDPNDCWWEMDEQAGREVFLIIFSRDMIATIPPEAVAAGGVIKASIIDSLIQESVKAKDISSGPSKGAGKGRYVTWATNTNRKDNDELITQIVITHNPRPDGGA